MKREVDVVVFGHTHVPSDTTFNNIRFLNPGSASSPRHGLGRTAGILQLNDDAMYWEIVSI
jgi:hypothetical protein